MIISLETAPSNMFGKITVFRYFAKLAGKHLCQNIVLNNVTDRNISQISQENTCARVLFLINLRPEKTL